MRVIVIGGGASGQIAAAEAAANGHRVLLLEQNEKLGKKVYISGKGRCNLTNSAPRSEFMQNIVHNPKFLYSALSAFDNGSICEIIERNGVPLKTERGGRVFPVSDKSSDVLKALEKYVRNAGVEIRLNTAVRDVLYADGRVTGVRTDSDELEADAVILATGGITYPQTGSTGDGYRFAQKAGHTVRKPVPSLVALTTAESWPFALSGLTLKNVRLTARKNGERIYREQGEMLLTHFGISGPLVLTLSALIADEPAGTEVLIDLKPALDEKTLDNRLIRDLEENRQKTVKGAFHSLLPASLLDVILDLAGIRGEDPVSAFKKESRKRLVQMLKELPLTVTGTRPPAEAIITRGGIPVTEVNSKTMESRLMKGLYFSGEILDVDALTGGFNLQIAWSTGALAGRSIQ